MTGDQFTERACGLLFPISDGRIKNAVVQAFDVVTGEEGITRLGVTVRGTRYEVSRMRDGRPDEAIYREMLRAAQDLVDQTKGTIQ